MIINHNLSSIFAQRNLQLESTASDKNMSKLSSGLRINKAGDDASGLAVSEKMRSQVNGMRRAEKNIQDGISFIQTTEGYLQETQNILQRVRELSVQSANGIYTLEDRMQIQVEVSQLIDEIDRIASHAQFNTLNMLTGRFSEAANGAQNAPASMWIHLGANMDQRERLFISTMTSMALGMRDLASRQVVDLKSSDASNLAIGQIDVALTKVSKQRADLGAYENRLSHASRALLIGYENTQAAESRIRDTDMAAEMSDFTKNQILTQASAAMLAQANQKPQLVLQLLR